MSNIFKINLIKLTLRVCFWNIPSSNWSKLLLVLEKTNTREIFSGKFDKKIEYLRGK